MDLTRLELQIGKTKIDELEKKSIFIIGLGGVGGYAFETLVRCGIQNFIIADFDTFTDSNINRQLACTKNTIGKYKVDVYEERAKTINPNVNIIKIKEKITIQNIENYFSKKVDFIIDACDDLKIKEELIRQKVKRKIPMIASMGTGNKRHPEQLQIEELSKTSYDPLAKRLRKMVKEEHIKEKIMVVYSKEEKTKTQVTIIPSNSFVPSVAGILCASYAFNQFVGEIHE